jgi:diguanylate cyclase (GGDEF)-like protein
MTADPSTRRARRRTRIAGARAHRDPWLLLVGATPLIGIALVTDGRPLVRASMVLVAVVLVLTTVVCLSVSRLRAAAVELVIESGIGTAAVVFLGWGLGLPGGADGSSIRLAVIVAFVAAVLALGSIVGLAWLASIDRAARRATLWFLFVTSASLGAAALAIARNAAAARSVPGVDIDACLLVAIVGATGAIAYPDRRSLQIPALDLARGHTARRAAATLGAVLVGPLLLVIPLAADTLSLPMVALVSVLLTALTAAHVYRLLNRWGALEHDVTHDALTGLPNRQHFNGRLALALERARSTERELAVLFIDLDDFKQVNDNYGHSAGNALLTKVAARLRSVVGDDVTVARLSGDEFAVLVPVLETIASAGEVTRRIVDAFAAPFDVGRLELRVAPSVGSAQYPRDGLDAPTLLDHADAAMYRQKARRRIAQAIQSGRPAHPDPSFDVDLALRRAISDDRLVLLYQPKVDLSSGRVTGVEALLRWRHPDGGLMLPDEFLPLAEENGMMPTLAEWVLIEACAQAKRWLDARVGTIRVAVNISSSQLRSGRLPDLVERVLRFTKLPPELLELEVSERATRQDHSLAVDLATIRATGVRCVIDDFGGGSLDYLEEFEFDALELDRRHVRALGPDGGRVLSAALAVGRALGVEIVVEGIETSAQLEFVRAAGGDVVQGYLLGHPGTAEEIEPMLAVPVLSPRRDLGEDAAQVS